jgi:hypothetical protein
MTTLERRSLKPKEHQKNKNCKKNFTEVTYKTTHKALQRYTKIKQRMKNYSKKKKKTTQKN